MSTAFSPRPLSFVVVVFSDEYRHNILRSPCVEDPRNELILVDNTANLYYRSLSEAILAGLARVRHDLVAVVHEDVYLPPEWQPCFDASLTALERHDANWGVIGTTGWTEAGTLAGHGRDPHGYRNTFDAQPYLEVMRIDEQIMVLRRSRGPQPDPQLPGIHHFGRDLPLTARTMGARTYIVDAPAIHKYADASGRLIRTVEDSPKIKDRTTLTYLADRACSDDYFFTKWPDERAGAYEPHDYDLACFAPDVIERLDEPVVLLSQGGAGSRLLSLMATDSNMFIGNNVNISGDCLDLRMAIYQGVIEKYSCRAAWQQAQTVPRLRFAAAAMLDAAPGLTFWGFKMPESMLLVPEISRAFPRARYVQLIRDPLTTSLRRTHMTARLDNHIGRIALPLAYRGCGLDVSQIFQDSPALHMAYSVKHHLGAAIQHCRSSFGPRYFELRFEDVLDRPADVLRTFAAQLNVTPVDHTLVDSVDPRRATHPNIIYPASIVRQVEAILAPMRRHLDYLA